MLPVVSLPVQVTGFPWAPALPTKSSFVSPASLDGVTDVAADSCCSESEAGWFSGQPHPLAP